METRMVSTLVRVCGCVVGNVWRPRDLVGSFRAAGEPGQVCCMPARLPDSGVRHAAPDG